MSALPSVMLKKKLQLAAEAEQTGNKVVVLPSLEQPVKKVTSEEPPPELTDDEIKNLAVEDSTALEVKPNIEQDPPKPSKTVEQIENDFRSLKGQYDVSNRENKELRKDYTDLKLEYDAVKARLTELENKLAPKMEPENDDDLKLTDDETNQYGESLPVLNKLLAAQKREIERSIVKPLQAKLENLEKNNQNVVKQIAAVDEDSFLQQVKGRVKDFDKIVASQEWRDYANQKISPFSTTTIGDVLQSDAHPKRDLERVVKIFEGFTTKAPNTVAAAYAAPPMSSASAPVTDIGKKPTLKLSERKRISDDFRKGRMSLEKYKQFAALYEQAEKEGRVDYEK